MSVLNYVMEILIEDLKEEVDEQEIALLTPIEIKEKLDDYVIGANYAKKVLKCCQVYNPLLGGNFKF